MRQLWCGRRGALRGQPVPALRGHRTPAVGAWAHGFLEELPSLRWHRASTLPDVPDMRGRRPRGAERKRDGPDSGRCRQRRTRPYRGVKDMPGASVAERVICTSRSISSRTPCFSGKGTICESSCPWQSTRLALEPRSTSRRLTARVASGFHPVRSPDSGFDSVARECRRSATDTEATSSSRFGSCCRLFEMSDRRSSCVSSVGFTLMMFAGILRLSEQVYGQAFPARRTT